MDKGFRWTDEQWEEYNRRTVTIGLDFLALLSTGIELLVRGNRLSNDEREQWEKVENLAEKIIAEETASI